MYQKDYILRMIEMIGDLIAGILGLVRKGDFNKASEEIGRLYYDVLREDSSFFRKIPEEDLTNKLLQEHNYTNGHLEILAELLYAEAELEFARGNKKEALEFSGKSLILFKYIDNEQKTYSFERDKKMKLLRERIEELIKIIK
ncbi:MAG: hypothetical protein A2V64_13745 [Bacteroidetes bacterium RBG_13_43_22]|nr:MAG: hypothetical protein A2V64_13745 [Bacteroidetes bacterium RBG_13_43_22]